MSDKSSILKSPLRYPGGKSRVAELLCSKFPSFTEYRELFLGGGSVFIHARQTVDNCKFFWLNDVFQDLYLFWSELRDCPNELLDGIRAVRNANKDTDGRALFERLTAKSDNGDSKPSDLQRAISFFCLNRMTFSGTTMSGGFSKSAFKSRFTESSIDRCESIVPLLKDVRITNLDYSELLDAPPSDGNASDKDVFSFLDPPYCIGGKSTLYGNNGDLHRHFDHERFFECCAKCRHKWLITYNDCERIRELFSGYSIEKLNFSYGMGSNKKGDEIIIRNY